MKLEVGMYVRTKRDGIGKIISLSIGEEDDCCFIELSKRRTGIKEHNILKANHSIIDLVQVGDYVNGCYVSNKRASVNEHLGGHPKGIGIIKCNAYFNQGNYNDCKFEWIEEKDIKSILTKEQFESMSYKIGD